MIPVLYNRFLPVLHHGDVSADGTTRRIARPPRWSGATARVSIATVGILLITIAATSTAAAHPFDARFYSHRIVIEARPGTLGVVVSMEIPAAQVMKDFAAAFGDREEVGEEQDREFASQVFARMGQNLTVLVDGEVREMAWQPVPDVPNGVGNGRFFVYHVQATTPVTFGGEPTEVLVTNDNEIDRPAYYSGWVFAEDGVVAVESSLTGIGRDAAGDDAFDKAGAWSADPVNRDLAVTLRIGPPEPAEPAESAATDPTPDAPAGEGDGLRPGQWIAIAIPVLTAITVTLAIALRRR